MRSVALIITFLITPLAFAAQKEPRKPNILFIALDDLNDWIGCLGGHPQTITPNLDRLAASGILFSNAHCPATACNPSRTAIMTGISPSTSGMYSNRQVMREILPDTKIISQYFRDHGYHAAGSGKMLHYFTDAQSWDEYYPAKESENPIPESLDPPVRPASLPIGGPWQYTDTDWSPVETTDKDFGGDYLVTQYVSEQLSKTHEKPLFLACGIYRPHEPWFVPAKYFKPFPLDSIQLPPGYKKDDLADLPEGSKRYTNNRYFDHITAEGQWKKGIQGYLASIHYADAMLGRVLDALEKGPNADNTIVILWSDHGWQLGEKERWQKYSPWRDVTRVPLMIKVPKNLATNLPAGTPAGAVCNAPVNLISMQPTLIALAGLPSNPNAKAPDLTPLLKNPKASWPHHSTTYLAQRGAYTTSATDWTHIHYQNGDEELYHIASDPHEWTNLANKPEHQAKLAEMQKLAPANFAPAPEASFASLPTLTWQPSTEKPTTTTDNTNPQVDIQFLNNTGKPLQLNNTLTPENTPLPVGKKTKIRSYLGGTWIVLNSENKIIGSFKVGDRKAKAIIPK